MTKSERRFSALLLAGCLTAAGTFAPAAETPAEIAFPTGQRLRAFGRNQITRIQDGPVIAYRFRSENPERAAIVANKFMADLLDTSALAPDGFVETPGGQAFAVTRDGQTATLLGAPSREALAAYFARHPDAAASIVREAGPYPQFLDRFGWGVYGMGGLENVHDWMNFGKEKIVKDPVEDLEFLKSLKGLHFDAHLDPTQFDNGDGLMNNAGRRWKTKYAIENDIPFSHRFYINAGGADWTARRFPQYLEQPAWFLQSGWHGRELFWKTNNHLTWFAPEFHGYLARKSQLMMKAAQSPENRGWMHPHGELAHDSWYDMHADYSPYAHASWQNYLKEKGVTLEEASALYRRPAHAPFLAFEQIPVPEFATFAGLPGRVMELDGDWFAKADLDKAPADPDFWTRPVEERYTGDREKWYAPDLDVSGWRTIRMPGSEEMYALGANGRVEDSGSIWFRRTFVYNPAPAAGKRVYLYFFPSSHDWVHSGNRLLNHVLYLNGVEAGRIGQWGALDVTDQLANGANDLAIHLFGGTWNGRIFLSTDKPRAYPDLPDGQNKLWDLWTDWRLDTKHDAWAYILDAMRAIDPEKPIKFMAPIGFGTRRWMDLAYRYGGYAHFTGEGMWYFPWYKRYSKLYGIPASSELAGPASGDQTAYVRRVFLAGIDAHEPVFQLQTYSRDPAIREFWVQHQPLFERMGTYDIYGPQVLIYRTTRNTLGSPVLAYPPVGDNARPLQSAWNWDIGRGTLQTLGQSYLYLDDFGLEDGKAQGYPLMVDCGNEIMTSEEVAGLRAYVEGGGVYVALPFTGRSTPQGIDTWPIRTVTGVVAAKDRPTGGKVTFADNPSVLKSLAGKTFDDNGRCLEHLGRDLNAYSVELEAPEGVEVVARFENGAPAVTWRRLGRGGVLTMGSVFWRDAADIQGLWWPGVKETDFVAALLDGLDFPKAWCESSDRLVWPQPYRSNSGLDFVTVLVNWNEEGVQKPTITLRPPNRPARIFRYGAGGKQEVPFTWEADGRAVMELEIPSREVVVLAAESFDPDDTIRHWWSRQNETWRELPAATVGELTAYDEGQWADPTQNLVENGRFTNEAPEGDAWTRPGFDDSDWTPSPLDVFNFWGARDDAPLWARATFRVNPAWKGDGEIRLLSSTWGGWHYLTPARMILNGVEIHGFTRNGFNEFEVASLLRDGENVVAFEFQGGAKYVGMIGSLWLYHRPKPLRSFDLSGAWVGEEGATLMIPGKGKAALPARSFFVPEDWRGQYQVRWHATGNPQSILGVRVNGRTVRRHHHNLGQVCDVDITRFLRFGEENRLEIVHAADGGTGRRADLPRDWEFDSLRLDLFPPLK